MLKRKQSDLLKSRCLKLTNTTLITKGILLMGVFCFIGFGGLAQTEDKISIADSLASLGNTLRKQHLYDAADSVLYRAKKIYLEEANFKGWFSCVSRIDSNAKAQGKNQQSIDSLTLYKKLIPENESYTLGKVLFKLGFNYMAIGKTSSAIQSFKEAQNIFSEQNEDIITDRNFSAYYINDVNNIAICYSRLQDNISALKYSNAALELCDRYNDYSLYNEINIESGRYYYFIGHYQNAKIQYLKSLENGVSKSDIHPLLADIYLDEDSLEKVRHYLLEDIPSTLSEDYYNSLSDYYKKLGNLSEEIAQREKQIELVEESPYSTKRYKIKNKVKYAKSLFKNGNTELMLKEVSDVLSMAYPNLIDSTNIFSRPPATQSFPDIWIIEALYLKAIYFKNQYTHTKNERLLAESKYYYDLLLSHLDKLKLSYNAQNAQYRMGSYSQKIYAEEIDFYSAQYKEVGDLAYFDNALRLSQSANSFVLRNAIAVREALISSQVSQDSINIYLELASNAGREKDIEKGEKNPIEIFEDYNAQILKNYPSFQKYQEENALSTIDIQNALDDKSILIKFYSFENRIFRFAISKNDVFVDRIELDSTFYNLINTNEEISTNDHLWDESIYKQNSKKIYDIVIKEVLDKSQFEEKEHLYIIPDGPLKSISFSALVTSHTPDPLTSDDYLLNDYAISYLYYCSQLKHVNKEKRFEGRFVGFGLEYKDDFLKEIIDNYKSNVGHNSSKDRSFSLEKLEFADDETQDIASIFNGKSFVNSNATLSEVLRNIQKYSVVHFSAHSLLDMEDYLESSIIFNKDDNDNYKLRYQDILNLNLNSNLVVLSACQTGMGKSFEGEGLVSLSQAFIQSGCKSTVGAHWKVPDESTHKVMRLFYSNLEAGMSKSSALQLAQIEYLNNEELSTPRTRSPLYWASWSIYGIDNPIPSHHISLKYLYLLGGLGFVLLIALLLRMRVGRKE